MQKEYGDRATNGDRAKLQMLRDEAQRLEKNVAEMREKQNEAYHEDRGSEDETEESEDDDVVDILPE
jgi:hypothetical protein